MTDPQPGSPTPEFNLASDIHDPPTNGDWDLITESETDLVWHHNVSNAQLRLEQDRPATGDLPFTVSLKSPYVDEFKPLNEHDYRTDALNTIAIALEIYATGYADAASDHS